MLMVGKTSEETNLVNFIEKNKLYYDGYYWFVLCIQHHFSPATHNSLKINPTNQQSLRIEFKFKFKFAKTFCL